MFEWVSGLPVVYDNWAPGEPNNSGGEDCTHFNWFGTQWNDLSCFSTQPYVCESP